MKHAITYSTAYTASAATQLEVRLRRVETAS